MSSVLQPWHILLAALCGLMIQRHLLAVKAHTIGRKALRELTTVVTPHRLSGEYSRGKVPNVVGNTTDKLVIDSPRQHPTREVVNDCMQICFAAVEQSDKRSVHMPGLVGPCGPDADRRLCRMHKLSWSAPVICTHQSVPRGRGCKDSAEPLTQAGQSPCWHVTVLIAGDHVPDDQGLLPGELLR